MRLLMSLAPDRRILPDVSVWTSIGGKSIAVAPRGSAISRPLGVKQKTLSWNNSSLVCSRTHFLNRLPASASIVCSQAAICAALAHHRRSVGRSRRPPCSSRARRCRI